MQVQRLDADRKVEKAQAEKVQAELKAEQAELKAELVVKDMRLQVRSVDGLCLSTCSKLTLTRFLSAKPAAGAQGSRLLFVARRCLPAGGSEGLPDRARQAQRAWGSRCVFY